jgi:hypothetical protein
VANRLELFRALTAALAVKGANRDQVAKAFLMAAEALIIDPVEDAEPADALNFFQMITFVILYIAMAMLVCVAIIDHRDAL